MADIDEWLAGLTDEERLELCRYARADGWRAGDLSWKLDEDQRTDSAALWSKPDDFIAAISRQRGKSFWACCEVVGFALRNPGCSIKYASKTQKSVRAIIEPLFKEILADCPDDLRPTFDSQAGIWRWPNGSEATVAGTDNKHYENLRGTKAHFIVKDEAGFFDDYDEVDAVLAPQTLTTKGITLEISTPPETPAHPFEARYRAAMARGRSVHRTIYGHPRLTPEEVDAAIAKEAGKRGMAVDEFKRGTYFRREYLADFVTEETRAVVPGWNQERAAQLIREVERPEFFDGYAGLDLGYGDPHGALLGYWHFPLAKLVIEHEVFLRHANTEKLATAYKAAEKECWGAEQWAGTLRALHAERTDEALLLRLPEWARQAIQKSEAAPLQPYLRVGDNDLLALDDLHSKHGLTFLPTAKDEKHLQTDALDIMVRRGDVIIHPRCVNLIRQLYTTLWNRQRTSFERANGEHGDLIDALLYIIRNLRRHRDPRPPGHGLNHEVHHWRRDRARKANPLKRLVGG